MRDGTGVTAPRRPHGYGPLAGLASDGQLRALHAMASACPADAADLLGRAEQVVQRLEALGLGARLRLLAGRLMDRLAPLAQLLMAAIFPAPAFWGGRTDLAADAVAALAARGEVRRVHMITDDHIALDGLLVAGPAEKTAPDALAQRPILVMAGGNGMTGESLLYDARRLATHHGVRVLLYNSRGVGRSAGRAGRTQHLVADARAALRFALAHAPTIGTFGISLGGGVLTAALAEAYAAGELRRERVRVHVVCHSFASLPNCVGGLIDGGGAPRGVRGAAARAAGWLARTAVAAALWLTRMNPLDSAATLRAGPVAMRTVVLAADGDEVMRGRGCLGRALAAKGAAGDAGVRCIRTLGAHHMDLATYFARPELLRTMGRDIRAAWVEPLTAPRGD